MISDNAQTHFDHTLELAIDLAKKQTIDSFEIHLDHDESKSIGLRDGTCEKNEYSISQNLTVTVYKGQCSGLAETSDLTAAGITKTLKMAAAIASVTEADPFAGVVDAHRLCTPDRLDSIYHPWHNFSTDAAITLARECEDYGKSQAGISASEGVEIETVISLSGYANSLDFCHSYPQSFHSLSLGFIAKDHKTSEMQRDELYYAIRDINHLPSPEHIGKTAAQKTLARLRPRRPKSGAYPIILSPNVAKELFNAVFCALEGQNQYHKNTFLFDTLDKRIAAPHLSIVEDSRLPFGIASRPYDDEGVSKGRNTLIEAGRVCRYILDSYSARMLRSETTGNAGGLSNILIDSNQSMTLATMISSLAQGILIHETMGSGINLSTGDYSQGAMGFYIENGHIQYPIDNFTVNGNIRDMLKSIIAIATDDLERSGKIITGSLLLEALNIRS
ncbi:MAG: TldD/PmbA family protein [Francisellaceae bacterium]